MNEDYVHYKDQKIEPGKEYQYRLQTIDNNGLRSAFAYSSKVKSINRIQVTDVSQVSAQRGKDQVTVSWNHPSSDDLFYIIYRKTNDGTLKQVGRSESTTFVDRRVPLGLQQYAVKAMRKDGNRGKMSAMVAAK